MVHGLRYLMYERVPWMIKINIQLMVRDKLEEVLRLKITVMFPSFLLAKDKSPSFFWRKVWAHHL